MLLEMDWSPDSDHKMRKYASWLSCTLCVWRVPVLPENTAELMAPARRYPVHFHVQQEVQEGDSICELVGLRNEEPLRGKRRDCPVTNHPPNALPSY